MQIDASAAVILVGQNPAGLPSGILASSLGFPGLGGDITIRAGRLEVRDGATVSVRSASALPGGIPPFPIQGGAGNLSLVSPLVFLDNQATLNAETESSSRGNMDLATDVLLLRRGSNVSTNAQGTASGGNILIDARDGFIIAKQTENSNISANAVFGRGGRVDIFTQGLIGIEPRSAPTPLSDITASSEFGISGVVTVNTLNTEPVTEGSNLPDTVGNLSYCRGVKPAKQGAIANLSRVGRVEFGLIPSRL